MAISGNQKQKWMDQIKNNMLIEKVAKKCEHKPISFNLIINFFVNYCLILVIFIFYYFNELISFIKKK